MSAFEGLLVGDGAEWTAAVCDAIESTKKMRPKIASATHLFSGRKGQPFTQEGFQAAWQRAMAAWLSEMPDELRAAARGAGGGNDGRK